MLLYTVHKGDSLSVHAKFGVNANSKESETVNGRLLLNMHTHYIQYSLGFHKSTLSEYSPSINTFYLCTENMPLYASVESQNPQGDNLLR